ncbi:hypothetical protein H4Q26_007405 [Puccinia striiformis f. sp. tritici PST-130]|nr:hypothetical protein H4Q26_007405 [Puccinia striiformis f. sp. tritici PST-130]
MISTFTLPGTRVSSTEPNALTSIPAPDLKINFHILFSGFNWLQASTPFASHDIMGMVIPLGLAKLAFYSFTLWNSFKALKVPKQRRKIPRPAINRTCSEISTANSNDSLSAAQKTRRTRIKEMTKVCLVWVVWTHSKRLLDWIAWAIPWYDEFNLVFLVWLTVMGPSRHPTKIIRFNLGTTHDALQVIMYLITRGPKSSPQMAALEGGLTEDHQHQSRYLARQFNKSLLSTNNTATVPPTRLPIPHPYQSQFQHSKLQQKPSSERAGLGPVSSSSANSTYTRTGEETHPESNAFCRSTQGLSALPSSSFGTSIENQPLRLSLMTKNMKQSPQGSLKQVNDQEDEINSIIIHDESLISAHEPSPIPIDPIYGPPVRVTRQKRSRNTNDELDALALRQAKKALRSSSTKRPTKTSPAKHKKAPVKPAAPLEPQGRTRTSKHQHLWFKGDCTILMNRFHFQIRYQMPKINQKPLVFPLHLPSLKTEQLLHLRPSLIHTKTISSKTPKVKPSLRNRSLSGKPVGQSDIVAELQKVMMAVKKSNLLHSSPIRPSSNSSPKRHSQNDLLKNNIPKPFSNKFSPRNSASHVSVNPTSISSHSDQNSYHHVQLDGISGQSHQFIADPFPKLDHHDPKHDLIAPIPGQDQIDDQQSLNPPKPAGELDLIDLIHLNTSNSVIRSDHASYSAQNSHLPIHMDHIATSDDHDVKLILTGSVHDQLINQQDINPTQTSQKPDTIGDNLIPYQSHPIYPPQNPNLMTPSLDPELENPSYEDPHDQCHLPLPTSH